MKHTKAAKFPLWDAEFFFLQDFCLIKQLKQFIDHQNCCSFSVNPLIDWLIYCFGVGSHWQAVSKGWIWSWCGIKQRWVRGDLCCCCVASELSAVYACDRCACVCVCYRNREWKIQTLGHTWASLSAPSFHKSFTIHISPSLGSSVSVSPCFLCFVSRLRLASHIPLGIWSPYPV